MKNHCRRYSRNICFGLTSLALFCAFLTPQAVTAQTEPPTPPAPTVDPVYPNVFYGAINPATSNFDTPVLIFVPGLGGVASDWYTGNDMYAWAYQAGYRTAFISPNVNNTPAISSISADAAVIAPLIPHIATYYDAKGVYLVGHSKGGLDLQEAMLTSSVGPLVKALFNISTPNQGTALADWAFAHPGATQQIETQLQQYGLNLNLLNIAVYDLETKNMATLRAALDPTFEKSLAKPIYTWGGTGFYDSSATYITGGLLDTLVPIVDQNSENDGLVTLGESQLSPEFSNELGSAAVDHFKIDNGSVSFPKLTGRIDGIETTTNEFQRLSVNGFARFGGNPYSSLIWSMKWFNQKLYVGTGSSEVCFTFLTADVRTGTTSYPAAVKANLCPDEVTLAKNLAAEIWEYTPSTNGWKRVYQSPQNVAITVNGQSINTALDIGYRGMEVFTESDGTQSLYVGTVTSGSAFEPAPFVANGYPGPRILRTTDGENWTAVPQDSGTFLGSIGNYFLNPTSKIRSFRSLTSYNGQLFATAGTYEGSGIILASPNPSAGDNSWQQVSPSWSTLPTWDLKVFSNLLYATTGFTVEENSAATGYGVYRTPATGTAPYTFTPVVTDGGNQTNATYLSPNGLTLMVFRNELYLGTDRPTELIRIRPDDTWDLIVGATRSTPAGVKTPLSGMGNGFDNGMTGHFWRLGVQTGASADQNSTGQNLYLGTWDWSDSLQQFGSLGALDSLYTHQYGTDVYRTEDGVHFTAITQSGFGDPNNEGTRSLEPSPVGLFLGTAREKYGAEVFVRTKASSTPLAAPRRLRAESSATAGQTVNLAWDPPPSAVKFNVYRAVVPASGLGSSSTLSLPGPTGQATTFTVADIRGGKANYLCGGGANAAAGLCAPVKAIQATTASAPGSFPLQYSLVSQTSQTTYTETAPSTLQSLYYVRAIDANGHLSDISNVVGAPSATATIPVLACDVDGDGFVDLNDLSLIKEAIGTPVFGSQDPRDANKDGSITSTDSTLCTTKCSKTACALQ